MLCHELASCHEALNAGNDVINLQLAGSSATGELAKGSSLLGEKTGEPKVICQYGI